MLNQIWTAGGTLSLDRAQEIFAKMQTYPDYRVYVASISSEIVGVFSLLIMDNLAHLGAPSAIIEDVVVATERHRQGTGKQMMEFAIGLCRKKGCYKAALSSDLKRKAAHTFYESLGFQKHGYSFLI